MKILCVCKQGIVRSGALAWLLKTEFGHDAVSVGYESNSKELRWILSDWADKIICLDTESYKIVTKGIEGNDILLFDVGEDRWHDPSNPELHSILRTMIKERLNGT